MMDAFQHFKKEIVNVAICVLNKKPAMNGNEMLKSCISKTMAS